MRVLRRSSRNSLRLFLSDISPKLATSNSTFVTRSSKKARSPVSKILAVSPITAEKVVQEKEEKKSPRNDDVDGEVLGETESSNTNISAAVIEPAPENASTSPQENLQQLQQSEVKENSKKNNFHGHISVAIRNHAPACTSVFQFSNSPTLIAGLNWRLQILFSRNSFTGQSRFLSVYAICEDLPFNEGLVAHITFRLVSQEEGYAGMEREIIAELDGTNRCVGISSFFLFRKIFSEDSEYVNKSYDEAQIVANIRVKSRHKIAMSAWQRLHYLNQMRSFTGSNCVKTESEGEDGFVKKKKSKQNFDDECDGNKKEKEEEEEKIEIINSESIQEEVSNEGSSSLLLCERGSSASIVDVKENRRPGVVELDASNISADSGIDILESSSSSKRGIYNKNHRDKGLNNKITDFFPSRRSCRIKSSFLDILRLQVLMEQVKLAINEQTLEIFMSPTKGRGLRTKKAFLKDEFVVEYKGEVINVKRALRREKRYSQDPRIGCYMFYFTHNDTKLCIDATSETRDKGRLVNHSRLAPNLKAKVFDFGEKYPHLCLVALREIQEGEELSFDYGDRTRLTVEKHPWLLNS